ncbi:MAG TPA: DUF2238 domain-containing protein, partial [Candidatus Paceibacterota bacterium]|nr:DUF2238 domain-containing protein [Candidatus Paceibacterota bacterium]
MKYFPHFLLGAYLILFTWAGWHPYARNVWYAENGPIVFLALSLVVLWVRGVRFSNTAYLLMSVLLFMHTIGGHYTFANVPFDTVTRFFGWERNNYDRIAHTTVGFYAYPIAEFLQSKGLVKNRWMAVLFGLFAIMSIAAAYEIFEW